MLALRQTILNDMNTCGFMCYKRWNEVGQLGIADKEELTNKYARVGIDFHETMEEWGKRKMNGNTMTLEEMKKLCNDKLNSEDKSLFENDDEIEMYRNSLMEQLEWAYENTHCAEVTPLGVEVTFDIEELLPGLLQFHGTIDRIDGVLKDKEIHLADYKTGKVYTKKQLANNMQAGIYSLAFFKMYGFFPKTFSFYFTKFKKIKTIQITPEFLKLSTENILSNWLRIKNKDWEASCKNTYFCKHFCDFYKECPKFKKVRTGTSWDNI